MATWSPATLADINTGTNNTKPITSLGLAKNQANGVAPLNSASKIPIDNLPNAASTSKGIIQIATDDEATAGTDEVKAINCKQLKAAKDSLSKHAVLITGSCNWTCPAGVTEIEIEAIGGGYTGDSGGSSYTPGVIPTPGGAGGKHGNYFRNVRCTVVPGISYYITIGAAPGGATIFSEFYSTADATDTLPHHLLTYGTDGADATNCSTSGGGGTGGKGYGAGGGGGAAAFNSGNSITRSGGGKGGEGGLIFNGTLSPIASTGGLGGDIGAAGVAGTGGTGNNGALIIRY